MLTVRWYLRYSLSFRDLVGIMDERGLSMSYTTIMRWVHQYEPELDKEVEELKKAYGEGKVDEKRYKDYKQTKIDDLYKRRLWCKNTT